MPRGTACLTRIRRRASSWRSSPAGPGSSARSLAKKSISVDGGDALGVGGFAAGGGIRGGRPGDDDDASPASFAAGGGIRDDGGGIRRPPAGEPGGAGRSRGAEERKK
jgi:hypothetical protein